MKTVNFPNNIRKLNTGGEMLVCFGNVVCNISCEKCFKDYLPFVDKEGLFIPKEFVDIAVEQLYEYKSVMYSEEDWKTLKDSLRKGGNHEN